MQVGAEAEMVVLEHAHMWVMRSCKMHRWLRCRTRDPHRWRYRSRRSHRVEIEGAVAVLERLQRHKLSKLSAEDFWVTSEMVSQNLRCLLIFCKITALVESS